MFIDASACVAILANEPEAERLLAKIDAATTKFITSPVANWESVAALSRVTQASTDDMKPIVEAFHKELNAVKANITHEMSLTALSAFNRYGKGSGHKAQLNMGDCFTYAVAKSYRVPILYIGNDFVHTDMG